MEVILPFLEIQLRDMEKKFNLIALKLVLRHIIFYFSNIGCYFASIGGTVSKIRLKTSIHLLWNGVYGIHRSIFRTLEVILRQLEVRLPSYRRKHLFDCFEFGFTVFAILFLEHWKLYCIDWSHGCQDTGGIIYLPALKLSLRPLQFYF